MIPSISKTKWVFPIVMLFLLLGFVPAPSQDAKTLDEAACKAIDYALSKRAQTRNRFALDAFLGLAMLAQGSTLSEGKYSADLKTLVEDMKPFQDPGGVGFNWSLAFRILFLAEVYKKSPSDEIKTAMQSLVKQLQEAQASTGGWTHKAGWTYGARNIPDLATITTLALAALADAKSCGCDVSKPVLDRALGFLGKMLDGQGLRYGTNHPHPDIGGCRAGLLALGMVLLNNKGDLFSKASGAAVANVKDADGGHSFPPILFVGSAIGCYLSGQYGAFKNQWIGKLLASRNAQGGLQMKNRENANAESVNHGTDAVSTAALALILQLDKGNIFKSSDAKSGSGKSKNPFSQK